MVGMKVVRQVRLSVEAAAVAGTLLLAACTGSPHPANSTSTGVLLPATPTALPQFDPATFHRLLDQLKGEPVVVNVWASWCGPCTREAPGLAQVSNEYAGKVQFIGVDIQDQLAPARAFIGRYGWKYPSVSDPNEAIRDDLGLLGQPVTVLFDASGTRVFTWSGATSAAQLRAEIAKVVSG